MSDNNADKARLQKLGRDYLEKWKKGRESAYEKLSPGLKEFFKDAWSGKSVSVLSRKFLEDMKKGRYKNPSDFFRENCTALFDGYIYKRREEDFYRIADTRAEWAYSVSSGRRSLRTKNPGVLFSNIMRSLYELHEYDHFDADICDILEEKNLTEEQLAHLHYNCYFAVNSEIIAVEIDAGNDRLIALVKDILCGTSDVKISRAVIDGVVRSHNRELHELLGKLLLAARLEEGLRQNICEACDCGTVEAFLHILGVINENDLIRFSSVKRAVGTWLGFVEEESVKIERISSKSEQIILKCLKNPVFREECLSSGDSMKIFIALWSYGVYEADDILEKIEYISENGSPHQILSAGYTVINLDETGLENRIAKKILRSHKDDHEILAVYMQAFMLDVFSRLNDLAGDIGNRYSWRPYDTNDFTKRKYDKPGVYFDDEKEAAEFYSLLKEILFSVKGKSEKFSPCIFPWFSAELTRSDIVMRLAYIANALRDNEKIDETAALIPEISGHYGSARSAVLAALLTQPETYTQRKLLTAALCDKESDSKTAAFRMIRKITLAQENYRQIEDMLRYKNAEMRSNCITLLLKQSDDELFRTISRLIADKKEEKRTAALDMIMQLLKDDSRKALAEKCRPLAVVNEKTSSAEKILIDSINPAVTAEKSEDKIASLYTDADVYVPEVDKEFIKKAEKVFVRYFPDSCFAGKKKRSSANDTAESLGKLDELFKVHIFDEIESRFTGEITTVSAARTLYTDKKDENGNSIISLEEIWKDFYNKEIGSPEKLYRMLLLLHSEGDFDRFSVNCGNIIADIAGAEFKESVSCLSNDKLIEICSRLFVLHGNEDDLTYISAALLNKLNGFETLAVDASENADGIMGAVSGVLPQNVYEMIEKIIRTSNVKDGRKVYSLEAYYQTAFLLRYSSGRGSDEFFAKMLPLRMLHQEKTGAFSHINGYNRSFSLIMTGFEFISPADCFRAAYIGALTEGEMYRMIFTGNNRSVFRGEPMLHGALSLISGIYSGIREINAPVSVRDKYRRWGSASLNDLCFTVFGIRSFEDISENERKKAFDFTEKIYNSLVGTVLETELKRGDSETEYSEAVNSIKRIYGINKLTAILSALGGLTLERSMYYYSSDHSKKRMLSYLLGVCVPDYEDNAEKLREAVKGTDITEKRLIEAAMYSTEWLDIVGGYLGWDGFSSACFYFIAHMNEQFDDKRRAMIAKYTPLTEEELNGGAFDINWFRSAYETLGEKRFNMIYDAAKYISDGAKHSRARKYADAVLGKLGVDETEKIISEKRNKDLLMAYALIPIKDEDDICRRYIFITKFMKESRQFGSQRSASEKKAAGTAMQNLSINAGYSDTMRLTLRMETKIIDDSRDLFEDKTIDEITVRLNVDESGKSEIICTKGGKALKSIPAKYKKNEHIVRLSETKKKLTEQYRRTRVMFEQAMEDSSEFTVDEILTLRKNPVVLPILRDLVFVCGEKLGFIDENGLTDYAGNVSSLDNKDTVRAAHAYDLFKSGHWTDYQNDLFKRKISQPFKQVFRELYVKTDEELEMSDSRRYAGNQIQPARTVACLKSRRWVADVEDGLQKIYYNENIIARIYAMADWFSPADIEAPTLEWVDFTDRKTGAPIKIKDIPDIIFSEVMRDVDLAVSVAHAGGVDPEASHSTVEMRAALLGFTLPLFKIKNVEINKTHAVIKGKMSDYTVHLGSGVVHRGDGLMMNIIPVHSQHRGKLFLPFADDDPKTAEILTKIIYLAEDDKIKDPNVIAQIKA